MKYDVFISYSRKDTAVADQIAEAFDAAGISYFIDRQGIGGGMEFPSVLANAILESKVFLFLASENSYASKFSRSEVVFAFNEKEKQYIIPYIIDGSTLPIDLKFTFSSINWRDMRQHPIQTVVEDVLEKIGRKSGSHYGTTPAHEPATTDSMPIALADEVTVAAEPVPSTQTEAREKVPASPRRRKVWPWVVAACAVLVVALVVFLLLRGCDGGAKSSGENGEQTLVEENKDESKSFQNETFTVNGVSFTMVAVEGGTFTMGCTAEQGGDCNSDESPAHEVTLSSYYIGETEVTQALWRAVMGANPSDFKGDNLPVEYVSYNDIVNEFIPKLNRLTGRTFRLPTEEEWEYAARGGRKSRWYKYSGSDNIGDVAWYDDNSGSKTHPVKTKRANELGLYDMSGNVFEWCSDWYGDYSSGAQTDPKGASSGSNRVLRGGSWSLYASYCRVAFRYCCSPGCRHGNSGFRLVTVQ